MPVLNAGDLAQIRSRPIGRRFKLYVHQPETEWTGVVAGAPSRGDRALVVTTVTGNAGILYADCTVRVTDAAGNPKSSPSKVRFRSYAAGPTTMTIADNDIDWVVGDLLAGQNFFEIWPRFVYADVTDPLNPVWYKDRDIAYVDEDTAFAPKANPGPPAIGMISGGACDLIFDGRHSYISPTGGAVSGYNWAAIGGSPAVVAGGALTQTVTFRYTTPGFYYVGLTVTDLNAVTDTCYIPVIVDDGTLTVDHTYPGDRGYDGSGWALSRTLPGIDADESLFYDGAPVFLVADDRQVADTSFVMNRSNLRYYGWLIEDEVERGRYGRTGRYRAVSSAHILRNIPAFPTGMRFDAAPTEWDYATTWNVDALITYVFRWQSTVSRVCNVYVTGEWATRTIANIGVDLISNSLLEQMDWLLGGIVGNVRCSRQGGLRPMRHEWFLSAAEEAARNTVMTITNVDWQSARYGIRSHKAAVREFNIGGHDLNNDPFLAGSPGQAPLEGGRLDEKMDALCINQAELTRWAGQFLSFRNFDVPLVLQMSGEYDVVDPSYGEYVTAALSNYDPKLPDGPYAITGIRFKDDHKNGHTLSEWTLLPDPTAFGGYGSEDRDIPEIPPPPPPPPINGPPPPPPIPPPEDWPGMVYFCGQGAGVGANLGGVWVTINFTPPSIATQPTWTKLPVTGDWPADNYIRAFAIDKDAPGDYVYALDSSVPRIIMWDSVGNTWNEILHAGNLQGGDNIIADFVVNRVNGDLYAWTRGGANYTCHISSDRGSSWTRHVAYVSGSPHNNGNIGAYGNTIVMTTCSGLGGRTLVWYSMDNGASWNNSAFMGFSSYFVDSYFNYVLANWVYVDAGISNSLNRYILGGASTQIDALTDLLRTDIFSPDPDDGTHVRMVYSNGRLYTTADNWASGFTDKGRLDIGLNFGGGDRLVTSIAELVNEDYFDAIMYGSTNGLWAGNNHTIYAAEGETDITPEGKSGAHPDTGVDSIHYLADGPCWRGIQVVPGT